MANSTIGNIRERILSQGPGTMFVPSDFAYLNNDDAVSRALSRLFEEGLLIRLYNGLYLYPKRNRIGIEHPFLQDIANAIARRDRVEIIPTGASAANALGLSEQVPSRAVYITTGSPRVVNIGNRSITFKRQSPKYLAYKNRIALLLVLALKDIGEREITPEQRLRIKEIANDFAEDKDFNEDLLLAPAWIRKYIKEIRNEQLVS